MREILDEGMGLPKWTELKEFNNSPEGQKSVQRFLQIQAYLYKKIEDAPIGNVVFLEELGALSFRQHWFMKTTIK